MKTSVKIAIVVVAAGVVGTVAYKLANRLPSPDQTAEMQVQQILDDGGCLSCHSENPDLPFYASWPVAGNIVRSDVEKGHRQADLGAAFAALAEGRPVDEVSLAKMEKAISDGSMPVAKYYLVHWGSSITDAKKAKLLQWIHDHRVANYSNPATAPRFAGEPVQPLPDSLPTDARKAALGEMLYNDPRLSSDNTVSCASCHGLHTGGVDNRRYSEGVNGSLGGVNAPTVFNAALNFEQFWDGRAHTLADQAGGPPLNPVEMASTSWEQIIGKLKADPKFTAMFLKVYPGGYSGEAITEAIGEYEKTLITPDSRFDLYLKGDSTAITAQEQIIRKIADNGSCVIVGRAADYVLNEYTDVIRVFIYAPREYRIKRVMEMYGDTMDEGRKNIARSDAARAAYYRNISGRTWGEPHGYHLCIDSSCGVDAAANIICDYINQKI